MSASGYFSPPAALSPPGGVSSRAQAGSASDAGESSVPMGRFSTGVSVGSAVQEYLARTSTRSLVVQAQEAAPMWACRGEVLQTLDRFEVHEDMLAAGKVEDVLDFPEATRRCLFLSQTWLSFDHPDPDGVKFRLVRELLSEMGRGSVEFPMHWHEQLFSDYCCLSREQARDHVRDAHVWMDYWSVPQRNFDDQQAHIDSIWVYVQMSSLFIALVPPCHHRETGEMIDVGRWEARGWCRLESISNVLADSPSPFLIVESLGNRWLGSNHWMIKSVGQGVFTCCSLNHVFPDGKRIQCDKERIASMLENLFNFKISGAESDDDMFQFRLMMCFREHLLGGLPVQGVREKTLVEWLEKFRFLSPFVGADSGWTPLRYAIYEGRLDIAQELIAMGVDLEAPLTSDFSKQVYFHHKGMTILQGATMVTNSSELVRFLIAKRADMNREFGQGFTTPLASAIGSAPASFEALVDAGCKMVGSHLLEAVQSAPEVLRVCAQKFPKLLAAYDPNEYAVYTDGDLPVVAVGSGSGSMDSLPSMQNCMSYASALSHRVRTTMDAATMWACPNSSVLELDRFEPHENLVHDRLENLNVLFRRNPRCTFVSHTWLSFKHPDPNGVKFRLLQEFVGAIESGRLSFPLYWQDRLFSDIGGEEFASSEERVRRAARDGHVWIDYWSVPQHDHSSQQEYINSLWLFVQKSSLFVALVPPCQHQETQEMMDAKAWERRGWCRLESMSHVLADFPSQYLIIESLGSCWLGSPVRRPMKPPGLGRFTLERDKYRIAEMAEKLLERKLSSCRALEDVFTSRLVESLKAHLLTGLPVSEPEQEIDLTEWLQRLSFSSPLDGDRGWTPLRYAVYEGRLDIADSLLQAGADIESPLTDDFQSQLYFHQTDVTILQGVCMLRSSPEIVRFLVERRADVNRAVGDHNDFTALLAAALVSSTANFEALLDAGCDVGEAAGERLLTAVQNSPEILSVCCRRCPELL